MSLGGRGDQVYWRQESHQRSGESMEGSRLEGLANLNSLRPYQVADIKCGDESMQWERKAGSSRELQLIWEGRVCCRAGAFGEQQRSPQVRAGTRSRREESGVGVKQKGFEFVLAERAV